ncbi:histidine phosphatase family protein [Naasia lichenicola]|uniref:Histidine phosphatase family protein n=1 Tax=Naasia lichenicola TaxID=2565933 RepID=A0A4S4FLJ4_9MICO|nr:histidine phosphatase family protein [Naasia lichenicola]THG31061.1 histidine phosphatase family protein [Naasia lichenicola]
MPAAAIHLVRHGEVFNPGGVLYGRLDGFGLSERGHRMAAAAAESLLGRPITRLVASPLQRTQESAAPWAERFELPIDREPRVIEPWNLFEGKVVRFGPTIVRDRSAWPLLRNPLQPSWGEPYIQISARMLAAIADAYDSVDGGEVVIVSHQLPIWTVHRQVTGRPLYHDPRKRRCALSSITTLERRGGRFVETAYADPAAAIGVGAIDTGAV